MKSTLKKPLYGQPCNGCGVCCLLEQCPISEQLFGPRALCPALEKADGGRLVCGLMVSAPTYIEGPPELAKLLGEAFGVMLGAGSGCDGVMGPEDRALADAEGTRVHDQAVAAMKGARPEVRHVITILTGRR
jgi:hypothetical protein